MITLKFVVREVLATFLIVSVAFSVVFTFSVAIMLLIGTECYLGQNNGTRLIQVGGFTVEVNRPVALQHVAKALD
jgi:hypothetical protein